MVTGCVIVYTLIFLVTLQELKHYFISKMNRTVKRITLTFFILCSSLLADDCIEVRDRFAIDDLLSRYSHSWDSKDPEEWADLFIDEGIWQNSFAGKVETILKSNKERLQFAKKLQESFRQNGVTTRHHQTNTLLRKNKTVISMERRSFP